LLVTGLLLSKEIWYALSQIDVGLFGAILGFITLLNAAPLGFLISQVWFSRNIWRLVYGDIHEVERDPRFARPDIVYIMDRFRQLRDIGEEEVEFFRGRHLYLPHMQAPEIRRLVRVMITDYIHNSQAAQDETTAYSMRRWDMLITMDCVEYAIYIGLGIGTLLKILLYCAALKPNIGPLDPLSFGLVWILALLSAYFIECAQKKVFQEHAAFNLLIIQERTRRALVRGCDIQSLIASLIGPQGP